jgi:adenosylcobinamide-GDP ribazoletransferase
MHFLRGLRAATVFLTRIPAGGHPYTEAEWRGSSAYFPAVGLFLGVGLAVVLWLAEAAGRWPAALVTLAVSLLLTGAFHEDGLADTADALGGGYSRDRILEILKDSRVGTFGAAALFLSLALRAALLVELGDGASLALVISECVSRAPPVVLMAVLPYATRLDVAKSRDVARGGSAQALGAVGFATAALVLLGMWRGLSAADLAAVLTAAAGAGVLAGWRFHRRLGGITGDFLGATQQLAAAAILFVLAVRG